MARTESAAASPVRHIRRPETLTEVVIRHIREAVVAGDLAPGSPLPEVQLAQQLETSRGTVREALRALQDLGLVEVLPHRGAFVTDISVEKTRELVELRALLEAHAARMAVARGRMTPEAVARLEEAHETMVAASRGTDEAAGIETHIAFHLAVTQAGGNELLVDVVEPLQVQTRRLIAYTNMLGSGDDQQHRAIVEALRGSDPEAAERVVREHITGSGELVIARLAVNEQQRMRRS